MLFVFGEEKDVFYLVEMKFYKKQKMHWICLLYTSLFPLSGLWINDLYGLFGIHELSAYVGIPFTVLTVVFITNAINLIAVSYTHLDVYKRQHRLLRA